jgi:hypothetical protein
VCVIDTPVAGDYFLQVRTNVRLGMDPTGPADVTTPGGGHNRFAVRAAFVNGAASNPDGNGVSVFASAVMSLYANAPQARTQFHLARVPTGSGGHVLNLDFFDIADASRAGTLRVVPPPDSNVGANFTNCTGSGPSTGALTNCSVVATSAFNGHWETVRVTVPPNYSCNDSSATGCWVRIEYDYGSGAQVQDTTTWRARIEGDPVRLVE